MRPCKVPLRCRDPGAPATVAALRIRRFWNALPWVLTCRVPYFTAWNYT